jgi:acetyl esterase/lipase
VREHGHEYGADPTVVFVAGSSAGGHLAALAALTPNDPAFQPGFEGADTSVTAAICLYGYYGRLDANQVVPSSPQAYVRTDAPPFFVAHGEKDTVVLVEDARRFVARLRSTSSNPVVYAELAGAQHTFDLSIPSASRGSLMGSRPSPPGCDRARRHSRCGATGRRTLPDGGPNHAGWTTRGCLVSNGGP